MSSPNHYKPSSTCQPDYTKPTAPVSLGARLVFGPPDQPDPSMILPDDGCPVCLTTCCTPDAPGGPDPGGGGGRRLSPFQ
jgi:hypothetical protein